MTNNLIKQDINFLEFPLYVLNSRNKKSNLELKTSKGKYWISTGKKFLPDSKDVLILYYLMLISQKKRKRNFEITKYDIAKNLKFNIDSNTYKRIENSLSNWLNISIEFEGCFYDNKNYIKKGFHILEYSIDKETKKIKVNFNKDFITIIEKSKFFKYVNLNHLIALKRPLSRRLYEYLLKQFLKETTYKINILKLAKKLTISEKYPSQVIKKINPALKEINNYIKEYSLEFYTYKNKDNETIAIFEKTELFKTISEKENISNIPENIMKHIPNKYKTPSILKTIEIYLKKYDELYIIFNLKYTLNHYNKNFIQYFKLSLKNDYAKIERELSEKRRILDEQKRKLLIEKRKKEDEARQIILKEREDTENLIKHLKEIGKYEYYKKRTLEYEKEKYPNFTKVMHNAFLETKISLFYKKENDPIKLS